MKFTDLLGRLAFSRWAYPLFRLTGNRPAQRWLALNLHIVQHLMGIGSGSIPRTSGERALFRVLRRKQAAPYTIFDVGANTGQFAALTARQLPARDYQLHAFEPSPAAFAVLRQHLRDIPGATAHNLALGRSAGSARLYGDAPGSPLASLTPREHPGGATVTAFEEVRVDTIDRFMGNLEITRIDLLKIDVEGHELDVLMGAEKAFAQGRVRLVSFEFGQSNIDTRTYFRDFYRFFERRGMRLFRITRSGYLHPIERYSEFLEQFRITNYLGALADDPPRL